eukprot:gene2192-2392_t
MEANSAPSSSSSSSSSTCNQDDAEKYAKLFVFGGGNKAGMQEMDKEKQARVIYEMSKNTAYFKRTLELDEAANTKAEAIKRSFEEVRGLLARQLDEAAHNKLIEFESMRSFDRICCVLDMDMFFAAVEIRDQPQLRDLPVAVGGEAMISTSNYVARKYGVRAAMPGFIAKKLCPNLIFLPCNFEKYRVVAEQLRAVIAEYDPHYESYSLDEVYFDLTDCVRDKLKGSGLSDDISASRSIAWQLLQEIRTRICQATNGLTCSAGVANNFLLAKICADINKPDGQFALPASREKVLDFVTTLSTRKIPGIGKVTEKMLEKLGMKTMGDVRTNAAKIIHGLKGSTVEFLLRSSLGIASDEGKPRMVNSTDDTLVTRKSISCERTYSAKGICDPVELQQRLHEICDRLSGDMQEKGLRGRRVTVKVKDVVFHLHTRCQTLPHFIDNAEEIERTAWEILQSFGSVRVRLLGVSLSRFEGAEERDANMLPMRRSMELFLRSKQNQVADTDRFEEGKGDHPPKSSNLWPVESEVLIVPPTDSYECPVCSIGLSNLIELNIHLDRCLQPNQSSGSSATPEEGISRRKRQRSSLGTSRPISTFFAKAS